MNGRSAPRCGYPFLYTPTAVKPKSRVVTHSVFLVRGRMPHASPLPDDIEQTTFVYTKQRVPLPLDGLTEEIASEFINKNVRPAWLSVGERNKLIKKARANPGQWIRYIGGNGFDRSLARRVGRIVNGRRGVTWAEVDRELDGNIEGLSLKSGEKGYRSFLKTGLFHVKLLGLRTRGPSAPDSPSLRADEEDQEEQEEQEDQEDQEEQEDQEGQVDQVEQVQRPPCLEPLDSAQQTLLYCGHNSSLRKYLTSRKLKNKKGTLFNWACSATWKAIREWTYTDEGKEYLKRAGVRPDGIVLDHIAPKIYGRIDHPYNCFLLPNSANSYLKDKRDEEKWQHIGQLATQTADKFNAWYVDQARKFDIDCDKFKAGI